jgi:hypothetical protein
MSKAGAAPAKIAAAPKRDAKRATPAWPEIQRVEIADKARAAEIERAVTTVLARRFGKQPLARAASQGA